MIRTRKSTTRLSVEALEDRSVPAGHVMAQMVDGTLVVVGDDLDNSLIVDFGETTRLFGVDTSVNGQINQHVQFSGVEHVEIQTGSGDDNVFSAGARVPLTIATDDGADSVHVMLFERGQMSISTGAGADAVTVEPVGYCEGDLEVETGDGADTVDAPIDWLIGSLSIETGNGDDTVSLRMGREARGSTLVYLVTDGVTISTGNGDDHVGATAFKTEVWFFPGIHGDGPLTIDTGWGRDSVGVGHGLPDIEDCDVVIRTGPQNDTVNLGLLSFGGDVFVDTGDGHDAVFLYVGTMTGDLTVNTGAGNDTLVFSDRHIFNEELPPEFTPHITGNVTIYGGHGPLDELVFFGTFGLDAFLGELSIVGIEILEE